jgi:hypothetical protein
VGKVDRLPGAVVEPGFLRTRLVCGQESPSLVQVHQLAAVGRTGRPGRDEQADDERGYKS